MSEMPDWLVEVLATGLVLVLGLFFWHTGAAMLGFARQLIGTIQNWPQIRRAMTEAEAQNGGRYPLWYRGARVVLILALIVFAALLVWRKFTET